MRAAELLQKQHEAFLYYYLMALQTGEEEAIHQMRVALKKIFAICTFLKATKILPGSSLSYLKILRKLFQIAGDLRDDQIRLQIVHEYSQQFSQSNYEQHIEGKIIQAVKLWKQKSRGFSIFSYIAFTVELKRKLHQIPKKQLKAEGKNYILQQIKAIENLLLQQNWLDCLHKVRIRLKQMHRIYQLYFPISPLCDLDKMKSTELDLGRWHDLFILLEDLHQLYPEEEYSSANEFLRSEMLNLARPIRKQLFIEFSYIRKELFLY